MIFMKLTCDETPTASEVWVNLDMVLLMWPRPENKGTMLIMAHAPDDDWEEVNVRETPDEIRKKMTPQPAGIVPVPGGVLPVR